jgi:hypothetical protein
MSPIRRDKKCLPNFSVKIKIERSKIGVYGRITIKGISEK